MSKTLLISGGITIICFFLMRVVPYYEGMAFDKFVFLPIGVLFVGFISFLTFLFSTLFCVIDALKKIKNTQDFITIAVTLTLIVTINFIPLPDFIDGMYERVTETLPRNEIEAFSVEVRKVNPDWNDYEKFDLLLKEFEIKYPNALSLTDFRPKIEINDDFVSVYYGGALVKHWGYLFTLSEHFPIEHIPEWRYRKVYNNVWVYHDIW